MLTYKRIRDPRRLEPLDKPLHDYVMIDTETTGLNPVEDDIIEIGAVRVVNDEIVDTYSRLLNPFRPIPENITKLTGITTGMTSEAASYATVVKEFTREWLRENDIVIAHNAKFDMSFLDAHCRKVFGYQERFFLHFFLDTLEMSRMLHPKKPRHNVATLIQDYGIGDREEHRALSDALQEQQLYACLRREAFGC